MRRVCPCGVDYEPLLTGRGRGAWFGWAFLFPLLTVGLYSLAVYVARVRGDWDLGVRLAIAAMPVGVFGICLFVQSGIGHRGGCLVRRAARFTFVWPGRVLAELGILP